MNAPTDKNRQVLRRYTDQPDTLPPEARAKLEGALNGEPIDLYGMADLDAGMRLCESWIAISRTRVAILSAGSTLRTFARSEITKVEERPGLSATTLTLLGDPDQPALGVLRYSLRQQPAVGAIAFVLKQALEGNEIRNKPADEVYASATALPIRNAQAVITENKLSVVFRLVAYIKPYRSRFVAGFLAAIGLSVLTLIPALLTGYVIDEIVTPYRSGALESGPALRLAWLVIAALAGVYIVRELFLWLRLRTLTIVGEYVARDLRRELYDHIHKLSASFFSRNQTGSLISRVSSDTDRIWDFIAFGVAELLVSGILVVSLACALLWLDWRLGLLLVLPVPVIFLFILWMGKKLHRVFLRIWQKWSEMTAVLSDTIPGIQVVQAFNQSDHERRRFSEKNDRVFDEAVLVNRIWTSHWPIIFFGLNLITLIVWVVALPRMLGSTAIAPMEPGKFVTYLFLMGLFVGPMEQFGFLTRMINRSISSAHRVFEVLDTEPEVREQEKPVKLRPLKGAIQFHDVTFGYEPVRQILKGISFNVEPGEMIGLVGPSGAGKTTVFNLIARFYDASSGSVRVDGRPITELDLGDYRSQIGMVMQDPYLFHGSILENIRYGKPDAGKADVVAAAVAANAHDFICKLANGYDTVVGERGHTLSGGERQRVSIARAILHNPRILLLDEATSSVDTETERKIQEAIDRLVEGRTVFAIAHRLSTLSRANRLFVMKDGRIVEMGTHEQLLGNKEGLYYRLHNIQRELHEMYAV